MILTDFREFTEERVPGTLLFCMIGGSHAYNLAGEASDTDFFGVYAAPTQHVLSLTQPKETIVGKDPDYQIHEVGKFCRLLLKGNPTVVESTLVRGGYYPTRWWMYIQENWNRFMSQVTIKQYLGYAQGQLRRLQAGGKLHTTGGKYNTKWACHLLRLLMNAQQIISGGGRLLPTVYWPAGEQRDLLLSVRRGEHTCQAVVDRANVLITDIDAQKPWDLSEKNDFDWLNAWLLGVRQDFYIKGV